MQKVILTSILLFTCELLLSQVDSTLISQFQSLSLAELMNVNIASVKPTKDIQSIPSTVTIIDEETLSFYNFTSLSKAVETVAGFESYQTIIDQNIPTSRGILQNFYANKILIMINNIPTWQPIYGNGMLDRISINDVKRIEVLKGPASVLYGTNAFLGVINIILKNNSENTSEITGSIGYPLEGRIESNFSQSKNDFHTFFSFNHLSKKGRNYDQTTPMGFEYNGDSIFKMTDITESFNMNFVGNYKSNSVLINAFKHNHSYLGAQPAYFLGANKLVENSGLLINYNYSKNISEKLYLTSQLNADYFKRSHDFSTDGSRVIKLAGLRNTVDFKLSYAMREWLQFEFGFSGEQRKSFGHDTYNGIKDTLIGSNLINDNDIFESSIFLRSRINYKSIYVFTGGRLIYNNLFGNDFSFSSTLLYKLNANSHLKLIAGQSFRSPTMFELYFKDVSNIALGNLDLQPEKCHSMEMGYSTKISKLEINTTIYYSTFENLIQRTINPETGINNYTNTSGFSGYGFEFESTYLTKNNLSFFVNYNYQSGNDEGTFANYQYVPEHIFSVGGIKMVKQFSFSANGKLISGVKGPFEPIPFQYTLNAHIGYKQKTKKAVIKHTLGFNNINSSRFYTPEYIRKKPYYNQIPTLSPGIQINYTVSLKIP